MLAMFMEEGVPPSAVFAAAFGSQQAVASNADAEGRARNRRVEIAPMPRQAAAAPNGAAAAPGAAPAAAAPAAPASAAEAAHG